MTSIPQDYRRELLWLSAVALAVFLLDAVWYALELSGRAALVGGVYSTRASGAYISLPGVTLWTALVIAWSVALGFVIRRIRRQGQRIVPLAIIAGTGTLLYFVISHPLLLPLVATHAGVVETPRAFDLWYGRRLDAFDVFCIASLHSVWLALLLFRFDRETRHRNRRFPD